MKDKNAALSLKQAFLPDQAAQLTAELLTTQ